LEEADVAEALAGDALTRLLEHRAGKIDAGNGAVRRVQVGVDAGADADLEYTVARLDRHALDRVDASGMQSRAEGEVVAPGNVLIDARNEIILDHGDRQRARGGVGPDDFLAFTRTGRLK